MRRRSHWVALTLTFLAAELATLQVARADFSAEGRKKKSGQGATAAPRGPSPKRGDGASAPAKASGERARHNNNETKGPSTEALIARYTGIVLAQPGAIAPLQRLAQLYRERDGNLKALVAELDARANASGSDKWAAKVALAGVLKQDARPDEAARAYEAAIAERPNEAQPRVALAQLLQDKGDTVGARARYEEALSRMTAAADKEQTLRTLMVLALEAKDIEGARQAHKKLVALVGGSLFVRAELGRELLARGAYAEAENEFVEAAKAAAGDNRALAPALRDLGVAQAKQKKNAEALATLKRALAAAGGEAGVRAEILTATAEVYRASNDLAALVALLERETPGDYQRLVMLGSLYEETGAVDKAITAYRRALAINGKSIEIRLRVVRLLQAQGELDEAIAENERLVRVAPRNPDFVFQLCEAFLQRGDRQKALVALGRLEQSAAHDEDVLTRIADFYERIDEKDRATRLFTRLASIAPNDPTFLVELGARHWQAGDKKRAVETWQRIRTAPGSRAKNLAALGDALLEHDLIDDALSVLREAVEAEPKNMRYRKGYALALERAAPVASGPMLSRTRYDEARAAWEEILASSGSDRLLAREARGHIVTLWGLLKQLEARAEPLRRRLHDEPPDLEAGRLLAEVQTRMRRLVDAEATLAFVTARAPGDEEAFLALERVRVMSRDLPGAIAALEQLVEINPKRAREYYQRMAQYAAELFRDDDAIAYAAKAVALSPDDADGHQKLGEMYRRRQDTDRAIASFRQAIAKNDRLYPVYMQLAELLVAKGESNEADRLYRRVVRGAPDEELVAQAGRLSMQRNLVKGTLTDLENELLPLALGNPQKHVYRRLLVELYGQMAFPLVQRARFGNDTEARQARQALAALGARGVKPLLDALADEQASQVSTALEVLAYVENKGAGPSLAAFATGPSEQTLRVRAMVAAGALRDPALLPRYQALLAPKDEGLVVPGDPVTVAAAWAVARMGDKRAVPLLEIMLGSTAPEIRALGAIGIGLAHEKRAMGRLDALARAVDAAPIARAAAAEALGELGDLQAAPTLLMLAAGSDALVRTAAYGSLARLSHPSTPSAVAPALFADNDAERHAAANALVAYAARINDRPADPLPVGFGLIDVRDVLQGLLPRSQSPALRVRALVALRDDLARAAAAATASPARAMRLADALLTAGRTSRPVFAPFTDDIDSLPIADRDAAFASAEVIANAASSGFAALAIGASTEVKARALLMLAGRRDDASSSAIARALGDNDEKVVRAALAAASQAPDARTAPAVTSLLATSPSWAMRVAAAETLGALAKHARGTDADAVHRGLAQAAMHDTFAFVRDTALRALFVADAPDAKRVAADIATRDPDAQLREKAAALVKGVATGL